MSASKITARTWKLLAGRDLTQSNGSGSISSKHGGHTTRNRWRHGISANRLHHHLQVERFLANAQIIIEQCEADCVNRRNNDAPKEVCHLTQDGPQEHQMRLLGAERD